MDATIAHLTSFWGVEITFGYLKPDTTCSRKRVWEVMRRIEVQSGLTPIYVGYPMDLSGELLDQYIAHSYYPKYEGYDFIPEAKEYLSRVPIIPFLFRGQNAIPRLRAVAGATKPWVAEPGTIRHDFGRHEPSPNGNIENSLHCSDSAEAVMSETGILLPGVTTSPRIYYDRHIAVIGTIEIAA
jgi:nucleoside-diphosphate kinase